ncbi:MAG TPA: DoxX family protein [Gammaproteobacteria bacterium]|nr:DoxX family protein [Gammaproteobacteria bacterium]
MGMADTMSSLYQRAVGWVALLSPVADLALRFWVAKVFWQSGLTKIQSMYSTVGLFTYVYHVPVLSPEVAAYLATAVELTLPVLLLVGLGARISAGILFVYNIVAVISYPGLGPDGVNQHVVWGMMLLVTLSHGPGALSVDHFIARWLRRRNNHG